MKGINIFSAGDYAGFEVDDLKFYYGYEVEQPIEDNEDEHTEWCFQVTNKGKEVYRKTTTQLDETDIHGDEPVMYLLAGVALWIRDNQTKKK
jgi:hypothetical protein